MNSIEKNKVFDNEVMGAFKVPYFHLNNMNLEFSEATVDAKRVARVTAGGIAFSILSSVVIVASGKYKKQKGVFFGYGSGKSKNSSDSKLKAINMAKRDIYFIPIFNSTIPHEVSNKYQSCKMIIRPMKKGSGIIAGGVVRKILNLFGDISINVKIIRNASPVNEIKCFIGALLKLRTEAYYSNLKNRNLSC